MQNTLVGTPSFAEQDEEGDEDEVSLTDQVELAALNHLCDLISTAIPGVTWSAFVRDDGALWISIANRTASWSLAIEPGEPGGWAIRDLGLGRGERIVGRDTSRLALISRAAEAWTRYAAIMELVEVADLRPVPSLPLH